MTNDDLQYFKDLILGKKESFLEWLAEAKKGDGLAAPREMNLLGELEQALARIEQNSYGVCGACGGNIEKERLEARPYITLCLDCISDNERRELEKDLALAGEIQRALLPKIPPAITGIDLAFSFNASTVVGGDYYDFIQIEEGKKIGVAIGDVMGKGVSASLLMSNMQAAFRATAMMRLSPAETVARVNHLFCQSVHQKRFVSFLYGILDIGERTFTYANAGHNPPLLLRGKAQEVQRLETTGIVMGILCDAVYQEKTVHLRQGDVVVFYTDGVIEMLNEMDQMYDEGRLLDTITKNKHLSANDLISRLEQDGIEFMKNSNQRDDRTLLVLKLT